MKLNRLWIEEFKNLKDFEIDFAPDSPYTVLVGQNGSGKSNIFEALLQIFDGLERHRAPEFAYKLEYNCRGRRINIECDPVRKVQKTRISITSKDDPTMLEGVPASQFFLEAGDPSKRLLPEFVFGYYSGLCDRFSRPFDDYQRKYSSKLRTMPAGEILPRRLLYGSLTIVDILLIALWAHKLHEKRDSSILEALDLSGIRDVILAVRPPEYFDPEIHEPKTMGLQGLMLEFVNYLTLSSDGEPDFMGSGKKSERRYRFSDNGLNRLAEMSNNRGTNLFNVLLEARQHRILSSVSLRLDVKGGLNIGYEELSEGEKQLLLVMGTLRFAEHEEALFLLDEPDTHLNPRWSVTYTDMIEEELGHKPKAHIILATHDPLMLTELNKQEVQILHRDSKTGMIDVMPCPYSPKEMGVDGLLTSELFGLRAPIGKEVQGMINDRARLLAKGNSITPQEDQDLRDITANLDRMGYAKVFADPIYTRFVAAMGKRPEFMKPVLSPEEMAEQDRFANEVLDEIMKGSSNDSH